MPHHHPPRLAVLSSIFGLLAAHAQTTPQTQTQTGSGEAEAVKLSPFEVRTEKDSGYTAANTLAGSRLNTALRDTPSAISVFTKTFLDDIGALNVSEALEYGLNGSKEYTDYTGNVVTANDLTFQIRGFTGASLGRNYFAFSNASDSYNIDRLDFSRGPNSILFGVGGPGGIINSTPKRAQIGSSVNEVAVRVGSWDDYRTTVDLGRTLVVGKLAARANLLWQDRNSWREFETMKRTGGALALTYRPFKATEIRFDGEYADVKQVATFPWPAQEAYQGWVDAGRVVSQTFGQAAAGTTASASRQFIYDPLSGNGPISLFNSRVAAVGVRSPANTNNTVAVTDQRILPRSANVSGPGYTSNFRNYSAAVFLEQRIGDLSIEVATSKQYEKRKTTRPQGFNEVAMKVDVNAQLPNGTRNPDVGKYFTDGQMQWEIRDRPVRDYRVTASYELDLTPQSPWFGKHAFAALLARRDQQDFGDILTEVNITPAGDAFYPLDLTVANNRIRRRTALNYGSNNPALRGMQDPSIYPIVRLNGVTAGMVRTSDSGLNNMNRIDSKMIGFQSKFANGRIVLTGGLRNDTRRTWTDTADINGNGTTADDRDPITRTFPVRRRLTTAAYAAGDTRTYGIVTHATGWLSFFYNNANNFVPQANIDLLGRFVGDRRGRGSDYGLRLNLLDGKLTASIARYGTTSFNAAASVNNTFQNNINAILQTLGQAPLAIGFDSIDTDGKGTEVDVTANLLPNWRLSANFAQTDQVTTNIFPRSGAYFAANRAQWAANASMPLTFTGAGVPTGNIGDAIATADSVYTGAQVANGQTRRQLRKYTGNLFSSYTLRRTGTFLDGISIGTGINYRGKAVVGYDTSRQNAPIFDGEYFLLNGMVGYTFKLKERRTLRVQFNADNILGTDKLIVTDADQLRSYRYIFQNPRRWSVTSTLKF